jgi:hypothetical protein
MREIAHLLLPSNLFQDIARDIIFIRKRKAFLIFDFAVYLQCGYPDDVCFGQRIPASQVLLYAVVVHEVPALGGVVHMRHVFQGDDCAQTTEGLVLLPFLVVGLLGAVAVEFLEEQAFFDETAVDLEQVGYLLLQVVELHQLL